MFGNSLRGRRPKSVCIRSKITLRKNSAEKKFRLNVLNVFAKRYPFNLSVRSGSLKGRQQGSVSKKIGGYNGSSWPLSVGLANVKSSLAFAGSSGGLDC